MREDKPIVVLGAGSAGLSAAVKLVKAGRRVVIVEKEDVVGGLAHTVQNGPYRFDLGPHAFHSKNDAADELFKEFSKYGYEQVYMKACLLLQGRYFDYPLKFGQAVLRLNPLFTAKMMKDYLGIKVKNVFTKLPEESFEDWGVKRYGRTMYDMAFGNYSRKVWGISTKFLHKKLAQQKLPDMKFWELVKEALGGKGAKQKILYSSYYYPNKGIGVVFDEMLQFCLKNGAKLYKNSEASAINIEGRQVKSVEITTGSSRQSFDCGGVVFTIPIPALINHIRPLPVDSVVTAANHLLYRNLILVFMEVDSSNVTNQIMVYLLDPEFLFNRVGEQKNIEPGMVATDKTVLSLEICSAQDDYLWNASDEYLFELARQDLLKLHKIPQESIRNFYIKRLSQAYPIYDLDFDKNLNASVSYLSGLENVFAAGRQGLYINNDIHDSMKMGIQAAEHIIADRPKEEWNKVIKSYLNWRLA